MGRKLKLSINIDDIKGLTDDMLGKVVNENMPISTDKRPEEKLKCVVKKSLKAMLGKFNHKRKLKLTKVKPLDFLLKVS